MSITLTLAPPPPPPPLLLVVALLPAVWRIVIASTLSMVIVALLSRLPFRVGGVVRKQQWLLTGLRVCIQAQLCTLTLLLSVPVTPGRQLLHQKAVSLIITIIIIIIDLVSIIDVVGVAGVHVAAHLTLQALFLKRKHTGIPGPF